jgi:16S rRNA G966 N2-methylase RsmD
LRKIRKLILLGFCIMVLPGTVIYAAAGSSEVSLYLNNVLQKQPAILSEGSISLTTEQLSKDLFALFALDESGKTVRIYKPNINMVMLDNNGEIFGKVKSPSRFAFSTLLQVDHLKTEISEIKVVITDPADKTETIDAQQIKNSEENFWFKTNEYTYSFTTKGTYTIQVFFKDVASKKWFPVSEIDIFGI